MSKSHSSKEMKKSFASLRARAGALPVPSMTREAMYPDESENSLSVTPAAQSRTLFGGVPRTNKFETSPDLTRSGEPAISKISLCCHTS